MARRRPRLRVVDDDFVPDLLPPEFDDDDFVIGAAAYEDEPDPYDEDDDDLHVHRKGEWRNFVQFGKTIPVEGGLAVPKGKKIAEHWWSQRFTQVLESLELGTRLDRGRTYARKGQVLSLDVTPGRVRAKVQGSRVRPYNVRIDLARLPARDWKRVETAMVERASFLADLLAGSMPEDIEDAFAVVGLSPFPRRPGDLVTDCTCPDWENPCKHVAATLYVLADRFDADPFLIFQWRGRTREQLLASLRKKRAAHVPAAPAEPAAVEEPDPLPLAGFWDAPAGAPALPAITAAGVTDALVRSLGPSGIRFDDGSDLAEWVATQVGAAAAHVQTLSAEVEAEPE